MYINAPAFSGILALVLLIGFAGFQRSVVLDAHTMATEVVPYKLPSDPISHLIFLVEFYNATDEATPVEILGFINNLAVADRGNSIINCNSEMLAALNLYLFGTGGIRQAPVSTDNQHEVYGLIIPMGRKLYDPADCYPGKKLGDVVLTLDTTVPTTTLDNALISVTAVTLPGAGPTHHIKYTQQNVVAPGATGVFSSGLAIGNDLLALMVGMTSFPGASEYLYGADDFELMLDNRQEAVVSAKAPDLVVEMMNRVPASIRSIAAQAAMVPATHLWLDFDPTRDGEFAIDTSAANDLKLRMNYGVNEALTISQLELVTI
ncbi:MAG: hypothetical protein E3J81_08425 [Dehalococcoidia bacterium]|nr:MAG: hypothetical protein E3J81_08425 [Dehalococcoidia bacterium]